MFVGNTLQTMPQARFFKPPPTAMGRHIVDSWQALIGRHPAQPQPTPCQTQKRHPVPRGQLTAERQQAQPRATFKESPLVAGEAVLAQKIPAFGAERALGVDGFDIGVDARRRLLARPRPVRKIEASARFAETAGCWCVAFQEVSEGVG